MDIDTALVIAGGEGTRLKPLTDNMPKHLIQVNGKPVIEHIVRELARNGIKRIFVSVGYKAEMIIDFFNNFKIEGVVIECIKETEKLGTGGAIKNALKNFEWKNDVLALWGDNLFRFDLRKMYEVHNSNKSLITFGLVEVDDVSGYGVVEMQGDRITRFLEKPDPKQVVSKLINCGIFILNEKIVSEFPEDKAFSMEKQVFEKAVVNSTVCGFNIGKEWYPTDNMERYKNAIENWKY